MILAFYKAKQGKFDDKLIAWWTKGKYSHVEWVTDDYRLQYSSFPKIGVRVALHEKNPDVWDYVEIPEITKKMVEDFYNFTKGNKYDWMGILGFVIPFRDRTHQWFCSEWCSNILKINGYKKMWVHEPSKISPNKLYKIVTGD